MVCWDQVNKAWNADHAVRVCKRFVYSICQNNKIVRLSNMEDTVLEKFTKCAKVCGFFSTVLFECWLAEQANCDHMVCYTLSKWSPKPINRKPQSFHEVYDPQFVPYTKSVPLEACISLTEGWHNECVWLESRGVKRNNEEFIIPLFLL